MRYQDFVLSFSQQQDNEVQVEAVSPSGRCRETCTLPFDQLDRSFWRSPGDEPVPPGSPESAKRTGQMLYQALFSGKIGQLLSKSLGRAADKGGVRIILSFDPENEERLLKLPWETLFRHDSNSFLALSGRTPILRKIETPEHQEPSACSEHLRILMVVSDGGGAPLQLDHEKKAIQRIFADDSRVTVDILKPHNVGELREALREQDTNVLHYMGHGDFNQRAGEGSLFLGNTAISGAELAQQLQDISSLRLIFLNACHSARDSGALHINPFAGVAPALIRRGFPAVLAMSRAISDPAAIAFSQRFYKRLGAGDYIASAVSEGRLAICEIERSRSNVEWATPVLFTNHSDARLLENPGPSVTGVRRYWAIAALITVLVGISLFVDWNNDTSVENPTQIEALVPQVPTLILTEVHFNPMGTDRSLEWIEIMNVTDKLIDLGGYSIGAGGETYEANRFQLQGQIPPGSIFVIGGPKSLLKNGNPNFDQERNLNGQLQNATSRAADGVALFDVPATEIRRDLRPIDAVRYGEENRNHLMDETGDITGVEISAGPRGTSIERSTLSGKWRITSNPRPNRVDFHQNSENNPEISLAQK